MKYSNSNKPIVCMQTNSKCYKSTKTMSIKGILFHSTGCNNPNIKRYVQPSDGVSDYNKMISLIGKNTANNDWNHIDRDAGLNAWVGKLADGTVSTVQSMPWNYRPWGCGSGKYGSCNDGWIQFEICEDSLDDEDYFNQVYNEAVELTAYLCNIYGLNPHGYVKVSGVSIPVITCHADAHKLGFGSNHGDINHWFPKFGKSMETVRNDVAKLLSNGVSNNTTNNVKPSNTVSQSNELYRVRKSWSNAASQIGAYKVLDNAKKACKDGYSVFDSKGNVVYSNTKSSTPTKLSITDVAKKVINGYYGNGEERKKKLEANGYNYNDVQVEVNRLLKTSNGVSSTPTKLSITDVAKKVINGYYGNGAERKKKLEADGYNYKEVQVEVNRLLK